jgi:hypothetical protein
MPISKKSLPSVLPHGVRGNNSGCLNGIRVTLRNGLVAPNKSDLSSRRYRHNTTEPIFMNQGAQEGMDVTYSRKYIVTVDVTNWAVGGDGHK